jgi:hypothetical protein
MPCDPVRRADGRCVVSTRLAAALVVDASGARHVVARRRLRLIPTGRMAPLAPAGHGA